MISRRFPDIAGLRKIHGIDAGVSDEQVAAMAFQRRRQTTGSDFLQLHLHRVVAISCALRDRDSFRVWSLGEPEDDEGKLIQRFFDGIEKYTPQIVSWNGGGFDLPVLHYRGMLHGVRARATGTRARTTAISNGTTTSAAITRGTST